MRDVVGDLAHALQQPLDLVEHRIEVGGELVELVARARSAMRWPSSPAMICRVSRFIASTRREHAAAHHEAAGEAEQQRQREAPADALLDQRLDLQALLDLAPDQQAEAAGQREARGAGAPRLEPSSSPRTSTLKLSQPSGPGSTWGQRLDVAGDPAAGRIDQQVDAGALRMGLAAPLDDLAQAQQALAAVLLGEPGDLGLDGVGGLALEHARGRDVEQPEQRQRRDPEQREVDQRQTEGRGLKQPLRRTQAIPGAAHGVDQRHARSRDRSSGAGG